MGIPWITIVCLLGSFYVISRAKSWQGYIIGTSIILIIIFINFAMHMRRKK